MTGLEIAILPVIQHVVGEYITDRLTKREKASSRAGLISAIESQLTDTRILEQRVQAAEIVVRELDHLVRTDKDLAWKDDKLVILPSKNFRKTLPSPEDALKNLSESITARRAELGLPVADTSGLTGSSAQAENLEDGALIPPTSNPVKPTDWQLRLASLPSEVLRERERRSRESGK
jgi:hypothetical protein